MVVSSKPPTESVTKPKEVTKVVVSSKPPSVEKPKNITTPSSTVAPAVVDTPEEVVRKQNINTTNTVQKDPTSSIPTSEKKTFDKITSPVEVTPEPPPPPNDVKRSVLAMGRLLEPRSHQPIGESLSIKLLVSILSLFVLIQPQFLIIHGQSTLEKSSVA